jgi:hypothetical protein
MAETASIDPYQLNQASLHVNGDMNEIGVVTIELIFSALVSLVLLWGGILSFF